MPFKNSYRRIRGARNLADDFGAREGEGTDDIPAIFLRVRAQDRAVLMVLSCIACVRYYNQARTAA